MGGQRFFSYVAKKLFIGISSKRPLLLAGLLLSLLGCQAMHSGYPEQARFLTEPPFERSDIRSSIDPALPDEVTRMFGPKFASLSRLGVILILVENKSRENPILVSRSSVRLTLPDGQVLKPLEPSEMTAWLREIQGSTEDIFENLPKEYKMEYEKGLTRVFKGEPQGIVVVFRFPQGTPSGEFSVEYVLDLGTEGQIPVKQKVPLNLRP